MKLSRAMWALVLSVATFFALFAATGVAFADNEGSPMDGSFQVAPSRPGDRAVYALGVVVETSNDEGVWASADSNMVVERYPDRMLFDATGAPLAVESFLTAWEVGGILLGNGWDYDWEDMGGWACEEDWQCDSDEAADEFGWEKDEWIVVHPDAETHEVVAITVAPGSTHLPATLPGAWLADEVQQDSLFSVTLPGTSQAPCGHTSPLQQGWDLSKPVAIPGDCPPGANMAGDLPGGGRRFLAYAEDRVQEWDTTVFAATDDRDAVRLWFTPEVPYPVRMLVRFDLELPMEMDLDLRLYLLYELNEFVAGSDDPAPAAPKVDDPMAARALHGPAEAGVAHPFPLSRALQVAREDAVNDDVRDFFADHPQAYVAGSHFLDGVDSMAWVFTLVGGGDAMEVTVTLDTTVDVPPAPLPMGIGSPTTTDTDPVNGDFVREAIAPATMPGVADVLARWEAAKSPGAPVTEEPNWAHRIECSPFGCSQPAAWVAAGSSDLRSGLKYSFLGLDGKGGFAFLEESPSPYPVPGAEEDGFFGSGWQDQWDEQWDDDPRSYSYMGAGVWKFPQPKAAGTVGAAALLAGLAYLIWPLIKGGGALGLFSRIDRDDLLDHPLRADILQTVSTQPGIHFQELVRRMDKGRGTMEHHLRKLVSGGLIVPQTSSGFTCYFPKGKIDRNIMAAAPVLKSEGARVVLQTIQDNPGIAAQDVAARTGLTPSTVNYHLKRLTQVGLANGQRNGRYLVLTPTMLGQQALGTWGRT